MKQNGKSSLFLMELMIALLIFAVCSGVCGVITAKAAINLSESRDMGNALILAQNHAEIIKNTIKNGKEASNGTFYYTSDLSGIENNSSDLQDNGAAYYVKTNVSPKDNEVEEYKVQVYRMADDKLIFTIDSAYSR